jgi:hypothetical protein
MVDEATQTEIEKEKRRDLVERIPMKEGGNIRGNMWYE